MFKFEVWSNKCRLYSNNEHKKYKCIKYEFVVSYYKILDRVIIQMM